jgi:hypothetical protein
MADGHFGCRYCSRNVFAFDAPAVLYLMVHNAYAALKIGVTNPTRSRTDRLRQHTDRGWHVIATWDITTGEAAWKIEQEVLRWWRNDLAAPATLTREDMPHGGWTETAALLFVDPDATIGRVNASMAALPGFPCASAATNDDSAD